VVAAQTTLEAFVDVEAYEGVPTRLAARASTAAIESIFLIFIFTPTQ
jgi:hypothetical protein